MMRFKVGECDIDILPVVNGLVSEADKVRAAFGGYEAYAASLGWEGLEALRRRDEIGVDNVEVSERDIVYSAKMSVFGEVQTPSPAFCELVDLCAEAGQNVIPLDMNDEEFDDAFMECVSATQFTSVHHLAKKGYRKRMDAATPEELAVAWDSFVESNRGFRKLDKRREEHIAKELADVARFRRKVLAVIEVERVEGVSELLKEVVKNG